jgi:hypothetical protein
MAAKRSHSSACFKNSSAVMVRTVEPNERKLISLPPALGNGLNQRCPSLGRQRAVFNIEH